MKPLFKLGSWSLQRCDSQDEYKWYSGRNADNIVVRHDCTNQAEHRQEPWWIWTAPGDFGVTCPTCRMYAPEEIQALFILRTWDGDEVR